MCVHSLEEYNQSLIFWFTDREAIESLESEGLIYSTIDEFHYKSTANGWNMNIGVNLTAIVSEWSLLVPYIYSCWSLGIPDYGFIVF